MNQEKYIGMDVHAATISAAVKNAEGKLLMECVLETKAATILEFIQGLRGTLALTFEEGTSATWLHDLLQPHVNRLVVCDPRKNALLRDGNQNDRVDARNLAELLRTNQVRPVYHGNHGTRALKELGRSYLTLTRDSTRVMNRIKSVYRSWAIPCAGTSVYSRRHRAQWLAQLVEPGVRIRAEHLYEQLDSLQPVRQAARRELLRESRKHAAVKLLRQIPAIGPIRSALLVALLQTPHRFRTKRQLWAYSGFAVQTYDSGEFRWVRGKLQRNRERITVRGLNRNHNHDLKNLLKGAAISASQRPGPLQDFYAALVKKGMRPSLARVTLARKMAAITLILWKKGESEFRPQTVAATSRLSIAEKRPFHLTSFSSRMVRRVLEMLGSREVSVHEIGPVCLRHRVTHYTLCPLIVTQNQIF
jgi:transposase